MNKYIKLKNNILIFTIGSFGSKIINILFLPYYTKIFSTSEYGIVELLLTIAGLVIPIISLSISDAVLRFSIDEINKRSNIFFSGLLITVVGFLFSLLPINYLCNLIEYKFVVFFYIYIFLSMIYNLFSYYTKGIGNTIVYTKSGIVYTFTFSVLNIFFLSVCKWGIDGYFFSLFLSLLISILYMFIKCNYWIYIFSKIDLHIIKKLLKYSIPLIPNNVSWWISNSSDKLLLQRYVDVSAVGIYSVAYKIPNAYNSIVSIFINAWQISSVEALNDDDKIEFYKKIYNIFFYIMIFLTAFIAINARIIATVLFDYDFKSAWKCIPLLVASAFFSNVAAFYGSILSAYKYTTSIFISTIVCAFINIFLNLFFIPSWGIVGAAFATCICYMFLCIIRNLYLKNKIKYISNNLTNYWLILLLLLQVGLYNNYFYLSIICSFLLMMICIRFMIRHKIWKIINYKTKG